MRGRGYQEGDFFAVELETGDHGLGLVTRLVHDGVVAVHLFARAFREPPPPLALALTGLSQGDALWGTAVDDGALRRGKWPVIGQVPDLRVEDWTLPAVEEAVARAEEVVDRLTRLFAVPRPTAHLFTRGQWYILAGLARAEGGFRVEIEPARRLPHAMSDAELGAAVRAVLERPVATIPNPSWNEAPPPPSLAAAGCRTDGQFRRGAHLLTVTAYGERVQLIPSRKLSRRGFEFIPDEGMMVDLAGDERLGAALREALTRCR